MNYAKYADPECEICEGTGVVSIGDDEEGPCECAAERKAQAEAEAMEE